jgi:hypothetical protein
MRIHGNPEYALSNLARGREAGRRRRVEYRGPPLRPPERGKLLKTLRITDHIKGVSYIITLHQGDRLNNIEPRLHGQPFVKTVTCGFDTLFRALRKHWSRSGG